MLRDLEYLVQLQEIDLRIHEQECAKEQLPATVKELETSIEKAKKALDAAIARQEGTENELKGLDDQVQQAQQSLERSQERLSSIKTNREYDAVHAEIESSKNLIHASESRKNKLADEALQLTSLVETARQEWEKAKGENEPKIAELTSKIGQIDSVIAEIVKEREALIPQIGKSTLRTYNQIRKNRKHGKVISLISGTRTCTVCFKVLEPQLINEIKRSTKLIICQSCGSIFVWAGKPGTPAGQTP